MSIAPTVTVTPIPTIAVHATNSNNFIDAPAMPICGDSSHAYAST